jgi:hypothetical protein
MPKVFKDGNLLQVRAAYEAGTLNKKEICKKYKIAFVTLKKYIKDNNWKQGGHLQEYVEKKKFVITKELEASLNDTDKKLIEKASGIALQSAIAEMDYNKELFEIKKSVLQNFQVGASLRNKKLLDNRISKKVTIRALDKKGGIISTKEIIETRDMDGHEIGSLEKINIEQYKALFQSIPENPNSSIVINNNNQQQSIENKLTTLRNDSHFQNFVAGFIDNKNEK